MKQNRLPNMIIIGAKKCATTSLHYYLSLHPEISMSKEKELDYFSTNWHKGVEWYQSHFTTDVPICGESSPSYTNYPQFKDVAAKMYNTVPNTKLIYIVRNPIDRLISHYMNNYAKAEENRTLAEALQKLNKNNLYVACSQYHTQLKQYLAYYPIEQICILTTEALYTHRVETLKKVFLFLGVTSNFTMPQFGKIKNKTSDKRRLNKNGQRLWYGCEKYLQPLHSNVRWHIERLLCFPFSQRIKTPCLDEKLRQDLEQVLREDIQKLRAFTGYSFSEWSI